MTGVCDALARRGLQGKIRLISHDLVEEKDAQKPMPSVKELEKLREASKEAHERYKSNYIKGHNKRAGKQPLSRWHKLLTVVYTIALAA